MNLNDGKQPAPAAWWTWLPFFARTHHQPDFEKAVAVVLTTFTVFTGFTTGKAIETVAERIRLPDGRSNWSFFAAVCHFFDSIWSTVEFWALISLLSLLLRFLIGSAIHLNDTYVKRVGSPTPPPADLPARFKHSESTPLLFKDLLFLVIFGLVILSIARTVNPPKLAGMVTRPQFDFAGFTFGAEIFLLCGLAWALIDLPCRLWAGHRAGADHRGREWPGGSSYILWPLLDTSQFLATIGISCLSVALIWQMRWLALAYVVFLVFDVCGYIHSLRTRVPPSDGHAVRRDVRQVRRRMPALTRSVNTSIKFVATNSTSAGTSFSRSLNATSR